MTFPRGGSEYGGYPGLIQPEPHPVGEGKGKAHEQLLATYRTDPADPESTPEKVVDEIRVQGRRDRPKYND